MRAVEERVIQIGGDIIVSGRERGRVGGLG